MKFRNECKHYVTELDLAGLRNRMEIIAHKDKHCGENGKYTIKSLYFDNCYDKALIEKQDGIASREKFRIRYYNDDTTFIRLEKRVKFPGYVLNSLHRLLKKKQSTYLMAIFSGWQPQDMS